MSGDNRKGHRARRGYISTESRMLEGDHVPKVQVPKPLSSTFTDQEVLNCVTIPKLDKGDSKLQSQKSLGEKAWQPYRPNVGVHFFNEFGQILGCSRKDGKSWQTVQGGIDDADGSGGQTQPEIPQFNFPVHAPCDTRILKAAIREVAEEIGLTDLASVGCEFVAAIAPPSRAELENILRRQVPARELTAPDIVQLELLEGDRMRFYRYEFEGAMGMKARKKGYVGQEQHQLLFFLPSESISKVNLIPDKSVFGPDVSMEFKAVAWMSVNQFLPLCAPFKRSMNAYVLTCQQYQEAVSGFLRASGRGGIQKLDDFHGENVTLHSPHVVGRTRFVLPCQRRARSPASNPESLDASRIRSPSAI